MAIVILSVENIHKFERFKEKISLGSIHNTDSISSEIHKLIAIAKRYDKQLNLNFETEKHVGESDFWYDITIESFNHLLLYKDYHARRNILLLSYFYSLTIFSEFRAYFYLEPCLRLNINNLLVDHLSELSLVGDDEDDYIFYELDSTEILNLYNQANRKNEKLNNLWHKLIVEFNNENFKWYVKRHIN